MADTIQVIMTGGTIESIDLAVRWKRDSSISKNKSVVPYYLKSLNLYQTFAYTQLFLKDSNKITGKDRTLLLNTIEKSRYKKIIITHGTYTMPDTARFLENNLKRKDQRIILTGSMMPLTEFSASDAPFNLGYSIASMKTLEKGVYVCMNAKIFPAKKVVKMISKGKFGQ